MVIVLHGDIYELSTWHTMLKVLFSIFVIEDIQYNYTTDFNGTGEFQSVLKHDLQTRSKNIKDYGTLKNKAKFDYNGDNKIRIAVNKTMLKYF